MAFAAKLEGWSLQTIRELVAFARYGVYPDDKLLKSLGLSTQLLPPQELSTLTVDMLRHMVPRSKKVSSWSSERLLAFNRLVSQSKYKPRFSDEIMLEVWPARTKQDLSIRRTRFFDTWKAYHNLGMDEVLWYRAKLLPGMDIITVINILNASFLMEDENFNWFGFMTAMGANVDGVDHWYAVGKFINDIVKKQNLSGIPRTKVLECGNMTGFRNLPYPGFDPVIETKKLAEGGGERGLVEAWGLRDFTRTAEVLDVIAPPVSWVSFNDFVEGGEWQTSGSSSVGKVEWEYAGESGKFKARKNLVPDVLDLKALASDALAQTSQINHSIIKSEAGKVRIAVSSDMLTYLKMSWLNRFLGGCYKSWPMSTLEESASEQTDRMIVMLNKIINGWNLPFDYAAFDHQPKTTELQAIIRILVRIGRRNIPSEHLAVFDDIADNVINAFDTATLSISFDGAFHEFKVTGGLMSGLRWTSVLGNAWNIVLSTWVRDTLKSMGVDVSNYDVWVRGDDSEICVDRYCNALLARLGYQALGAIGADGKFGIHQGQAEFLRQWYSRDGCHGYPIKCIPGLQQRKPWSSAPWEEEATMAALFVGVSSLKRRGANALRVDAWWLAVKQVWSVRNKVSMRWLTIPRVFGGLGIEPWDGKTFPDQRWPRTDKLSVKVTNVTTWRRDKIIDSFSSWLPVSSPEADTLAQQALASKLATDDIPSLNSLYRKNSSKPVNHRMTSTDIVWPMAVISEIQTVSHLLAGASAKVGEFTFMRDRWKTRYFGMYWYLKQKWTDVSAVWRLRHQRNVLLWFQGRYPAFFYDVKRLERWGLARWEALDFLFGDVVGNVLGRVHPVLTSIVRNATVHIIGLLLGRKRLRARQFSQYSAQAFSVLEHALSKSALSRVVYSW
jgi:hypothetical protein